ncbi:MAG TPA: hypothetical protein VK922_16380 [Gemmatimonadaceae bacterium]|nr:hypothetical protein [Gemmatimonadaceae bacterium]
MLVESVVIEGRFRGPPRSANGGYACGVIAGPIGSPATVRLFAPPPLDTEMRLEIDGDATRLRHGDTLIGAGRRSGLDLAPPSAPTFDEAAEAAIRYIGHTAHTFPTCFVCGPLRESGDGLRIFPGPVTARNVVASPWIPDPTLANAVGVVAPVYLWSALDCTGAFAVYPETLDRAIVLGELTAILVGQAVPGERLVTTGWALGAAGRKRYAGSAVYAPDGTPIAVARATWIEVPLAAFAA